ncbi:hypothetical protein CHLNCDRAFT_137229, partial [Chlorella variabilis]
ISKCREAIRECVRYCDEAEGDVPIPSELFDSDGELDLDHIFCSKCRGNESDEENDIILCDGMCNRAYHVRCLVPPVNPEELPEDEGWLCPACDRKVTGWRRGCPLDYRKLATEMFGHAEEPEAHEEGGEGEDEVWSPRLQQKRKKRGGWRRRGSDSEEEGRSDGSNAGDKSDEEGEEAQGEGEEEGGGEKAEAGQDGEQLAQEVQEQQQPQDERAAAAAPAPPPAASADGA